MPTPHRAINTADAPAPLGHYSHAVRAGDFLFLAGQIAFVPETNDIVDGGICEQTEQVFNNIEAVLRSEGLDLSAVVKSTVFLCHINDGLDMNDIYSRRFGDHQPARSTVEVSHLPKRALIEIEVTAYHPTA